MKITMGEMYNDSMLFRCINLNYRRSSSPKRTPIFKGSKLFILEIIVLFALWCADIPIHSAVYFTHVSERSISIHYSIFKSRCIQLLKNDISSNRLGGFGVFVCVYKLTKVCLGT